ncbi:MAG: hypothetical protein IJR72_00495 [Oscillospiraceae bacterium]|nr:hypothetical protein [Oscillospiraceae bacterium]
MLKRCWSFVLCFCLVLTLIPVSSAADADGYGVSGIVMDGSLVQVTYFCADKACLVVAVYDKQTSQMTAVGSKEVTPNRKMALISLSGTMPDFYIVSAFLLDSETSAPLCDKYTSTLYSQPLPDGTVYFNGHAYKVYDKSMTWTEAKAFCESLGGYLAVITSQEEQDHIASIISGETKFQYWLGATDELVEGQWEWVTGENWDYTNWDVYMPDNGYEVEHYLQIYREPNPHVNGSQAYYWNDITIDNIFPNEADFFSTEYIGLICEWG